MAFSGCFPHLEDPSWLHCFSLRGLLLDSLIYKLHKKNTTMVPSIFTPHNHSQCHMVPSLENRKTGKNHLAQSWEVQFQTISHHVGLSSSVFKFSYINMYIYIYDSILYMYSIVLYIFVYILYIMPGFWGEIKISVPKDMNING